MLLSNDIDGRNALQKVIEHHYAHKNPQAVEWFSDSRNEEWGWQYLHFLLNRKHVFRYGMGMDRWGLRAGVELAIGPHYFGPASFWSYEASTRFSGEASTEAVEKNLRLLDEFLGLGISS